MSARHIAFAVVMTLAAGVALAADAPAYITSAVADAGRPASDTSRDSARKPAEMLQFAEVKPGEVVAELLPGAGYFTRVLSKAVGPTGKVYIVGAPGAGAPTINGVTGNGAYANVIPVAQTADTLSVPEKVDLVWTTENYHDLKNPGRNGAPTPDINKVNKSVFDALKPGGIYLVLDHSALPGDLTATSTFHRIDPEVVRKEVTAAGFTVGATSDMLKRPSDPKNVSVFTLHDATDQFIFKFVKPR